MNPRTLSSALIFALHFALLFALSPAAHAAKAVPVNVKEGEKQYMGDLYLPDKSTSPLPLVLVVHEWWGKNDYPKMRATKIADELGYAALAVDMYGDGKAVETVPEAQALAGPFYKDPAPGVKLMQDFIAAAPAAANGAGSKLDMNKISAIGYCFGGGQVLNLARAGKLPANEKLLGVVSFHGSLASPMKAEGKIQPKILVAHGEADQMVKPEEVAAFKEEMKKAKADLTFKSYPNAMHAFTNPRATEVGKKNGIPVAYEKNADMKSWNEMKGFLKKLF